MRHELILVAIALMPSLAAGVPGFFSRWSPGSPKPPQPQFVVDYGSEAPLDMEFAHNPKFAMMRAGGPTDRQGQPALPGRIALAVLGTVLARR